MNFLSAGCILAFLPVVLATCTPTPSLPETTAGGGFILTTIEFPQVGALRISPYVRVVGDWQKDLPGAAGDASQIGGVTNGDAELDLPNKRAPATWQFTWLEGGEQACAGHSASNDVTPHANEEFICFIFNGPTPRLVANPSSIDQSNPPSRITISGDGGSFTSSYGMPTAQYLNSDGVVVAAASADTVSPDGSSVEGPLPDLSSADLGTYAGIVVNTNPDQSYSLVGAAAIDIYAYSDPCSRACVCVPCSAAKPVPTPN